MIVCCCFFLLILVWVPFIGRRLRRQRQRRRRRRKKNLVHIHPKKVKEIHECEREKVYLCVNLESRKAYKSKVSEWERKSATEIPMNHRHIYPFFPHSLFFSPPFIWAPFVPQKNNEELSEYVCEIVLCVCVFLTIFFGEKLKIWKIFGIFRWNSKQ